MRVNGFVVALFVAACSSITQGDTKPIFTLRAVAEYATWIAVGRVESVRDAGCSADGFGSAMIATFHVDSEWKGSVGQKVEFAFFPEKAGVRPLPGARYVVAFQRLHVSCMNVTYDEGFLPIDGIEVVTSRLTNEPQRQSLSALEGKVKSFLPSKTR